MLVKVRDGDRLPRDELCTDRQVISLAGTVDWLGARVNNRKGGGLCIYLNRGMDWRFLFMTPDRNTVDVFETFMQQVEERTNYEQRKTKSRRRSG